MGKRKSAKRVVSRKGPEPLDKTFRCLFCQHPGVVTCKMDRPGRIGTLNCKMCAQSFQMPINHLTQPIDIYSEWIDAAEEVAGNKTASRTEAGNTIQQRVRPGQSRRNDDDDDDEDDDDFGNAAYGKAGSSRVTNTRQQDDGASDEDGTRRQNIDHPSDDEELPEL